MKKKIRDLSIEEMEKIHKKVKHCFLCPINLTSDECQYNVCLLAIKKSLNKEVEVDE